MNDRGALARSCELDLAAAEPGSAAMFDHIAGRYDLLNRVLSFGLDGGWRRRCAGALALGPGSRVLDLATGTGDLAREIIRRYPEVHVVGLDPAARMLAIARRKLRGEIARGALRLSEGRAEALPFPDAAFDAVTIAFGIRNLPDVPRALDEMRRVTRPGGRVVVLELLEPAGGALRRAARFHVRHVVPRIGAAFSGRDAYRHLESSIRRFPPLEAFAALMRERELELLLARPLTFGACALFVATR